jgi:DNA-binding MarR family transcriptional regulator
MHPVRHDYELLPRPLERCPSYLMSAGGRAATRRLHEAVYPLGLTVNGFAALAAIVSMRSVSARTITGRLSIDRTSAGELVRELMIEGYVERRRNPRDARYWMLEATEEGSLLLDMALNAIAAAEDPWLAPLRRAERERLTDLLDPLVPRERRTRYGLAF